MERLTPPPSGRLVPKIWTQWPLSPRLIKNFGSEAGPSKPIDSVVGDNVTEPAEAAEPEDEESKGTLVVRVARVTSYILTLGTERKDIRQLRLLSPVRTKQKHDSLRRIGHPDSCSWMLNNQQFTEWMCLESSAVLCCYGPRKLTFLYSILVGHQLTWV